MKKSVAKNEDGKVIETTEHEDGSKGVTVHVNTLNIKETDPESLAAKEAIEKGLHKQLSKKIVHVTVLHKPSNMVTQSKVKLPEVRLFAETAVKKMREIAMTQLPIGQNSTKDEDFAVIEVGGEPKYVQVTALKL